jgi:hypothetical protein
VAQKFTTTALPRSEERVTVLPSGTLFKENSGATEPIAAPEALGLLARLPTKSNPAIATTTHKTKTTLRFKTISSQSKAV